MGLGIIGFTIYGYLNYSDFNTFLAIGGVLFGLAFFSFRYGVEYNIAAGQIRHFTMYFYVKRGKWHFLKDFTDIAIVKDRGTGPITSNHERYDSRKEHLIVILTKNHLRRIPVSSFYSMPPARAKMRQFAEELGLEITEYKPQLSEATKAKRYR